MVPVLPIMCFARSTLQTPHSKSHISIQPCSCYHHHRHPMHHPQVRALEVERSSRRSSIMQAATMSTIGSMGFLNVGTMLALNGMDTPATLAMAMSVLCGMQTAISFQRIKRLDQFERDIKGGA